VRAGGNCANSDSDDGDSPRPRKARDEVVSPAAGWDRVPTPAPTGAGCRALPLVGAPNQYPEQPVDAWAQAPSTVLVPQPQCQIPAPEHGPSTPTAVLRNRFAGPEQSPAVVPPAPQGWGHRGRSGWAGPCGEPPSASWGQSYAATPGQVPPAVPCAAVRGPCGARGPGVGCAIIRGLQIRCRKGSGHNRSKFVRRLPSRPRRCGNSLAR
jgi:hypothetical protein